MSLLTSIASKVLGWLGGKTLDRVLAHMERRANNQTERERIRSEIVSEEIKAEIAARRAARDIVIAEQGWWVTAMIRPAFAWPIVIWCGAVVADSLFHFSWNVAALPAPLDEWAGWIVAAYFLTRPIEKGVRSYLHRKGKS